MLNVPKEHYREYTNSDSFARRLYIFLHQKQSSSAQKRLIGLVIHSSREQQRYKATRRERTSKGLFIHNVCHLPKSLPSRCVYRAKLRDIHFRTTFRIFRSDVVCRSTHDLKSVCLCTRKKETSVLDSSDFFLFSSPCSLLADGRARALQRCLE